MPYQYEITTSPGLEAVVQHELGQHPWSTNAAITRTAGALTCTLAQPWPTSAVLFTATAIYRVLAFAVPRPKALLGHQHLLRIQQNAQEIIRQGAFHTITISAAGKESAVFQRLLAELAQSLGLRAQPEAADMHLRVRPAGADGWQVLLRLTPRPWAMRPWRTIQLPGALHGPTARAMVRLLQPPTGASLLNVGSGSGTIAIEALQEEPSLTVHTLDSAATHVAYTRTHCRAAGVTPAAILQADARALPYPADAFDLLASDLPFGQLMERGSNLGALYRGWLGEAHRVVRPGGRAAFLTHAIRVMDEAVRGFSNYWIIDTVLPMTLNGLHPRLYLLTRTGGGQA